jgi:hypothetical protein
MHLNSPMLLRKEAHQVQWMVMNTYRAGQLKFNLHLISIFPSEFLIRTRIRLISFSKVITIMYLHLIKFLRGIFLFSQETTLILLEELMLHLRKDSHLTHLSPSVMKVTLRTATREEMQRQVERL